MPWDPLLAQVLPTLLINLCDPSTQPNSSWSRRLMVSPHNSVIHPSHLLSSPTNYLLLTPQPHLTSKTNSNMQLARTTMGWQLRGMRVMVAIDNNTSPPSTPSPLCSSGELEGRDVVRAVQAPEPATRTSKADMLDDRPRDLILFLLSAGANVTLVARSSEV